MKIGYLLFESNALGIDSLRGIEIAISDFGDEILGHPIELNGFNSDCNKLAVQYGAQVLLEDKTIIYTYLNNYGEEPLSVYHAYA